MPAKAEGDALRHGMQTDLLSIGDQEVRDRYRTLVRLGFDIGWRCAGQGNRVRQVKDMRGYLRYVQFTLEAVIDGRPVPEPCEPPVLERTGDDQGWEPPELPAHWRDPADGS
ncbi:hypothetical protein [Streptomyces yaizuensis]|uniref:Uncharacterized protein n=1 Tax=Streptomyces yaizuensis TaxID=2989713 RepID=A0ABQ5P9K3_9ACTN|nr:hypothetical protein [Streptomyces sp. YSPA8]GLF99265.1 hypothetical protein SYYSPA8_33230 [Streptomyces sp. YSPA8]